MKNHESSSSSALTRVAGVDVASVAASSGAGAGIGVWTQVAERVRAQRFQLLFSSWTNSFYHFGCATFGCTY